jgi:hypothetical protein
MATWAGFGPAASDGVAVVGDGDGAPCATARTTMAPRSDRTREGIVHTHTHRNGCVRESSRKRKKPSALCHFSSSRNGKLLPEVFSRVYQLQKPTEQHDLCSLLWTCFLRQRQVQKLCALCIASLSGVRPGQRNARSREQSELDASLN